MFISYSHRDGGSYVERLAEHLTAAGFAVWNDQVDTCGAFVVVMTPDAAQSERVEIDIARARELKRPILPLLLAGRRFLSLASTQYHDVRDGTLPGPAFIDALRRLLPSPSGAELCEPTGLLPRRGQDHASTYAEGVRSSFGTNVRVEWITPELAGVEVVILLQGTNLFGDPVYSYLKLMGSSLRTMVGAMEAGHSFKPAEYGEVVEAGRGSPSVEVQERMKRQYHMIDAPRS